MKIKMLRTEKGSIDGFTVNVYEVGSEVNLPEDLAKVFISIGAAEAVKENRIEPEPVETPEILEGEEEAEEVIETPEKPKKGWRK
jgi:hypothetical protein